MVDEMVADYDVRSPASRTLLTVGATLLAVAVVVGLVLGVSLLMRETKVTTSVVDLQGSAQLVVAATSADIAVVQGADDVVKFTARVTSGLRETDYQLGRRDDVIKVISGCQRWLSPGCGVALTIEVPKGLPVVIATTSGDIEARAISEGVLTVSSTSGDITARGIVVDEFSAKSRSGDVSTTFAEQPFAFKAATTRGDIMAGVPAGRRTYEVTARSASGEVSSQIDSDANGEGFIRATTESGNISLRSR